MNPEISFVVITMDRCDDLRRCLESIRSITYENLEVVVVDNGSRDGSAAMVAREFPEVVLVINETNRGVSGGRNDGIRAASGALIAFLDDDAIMSSPDAGQKIAAYFEASASLGCLCFAMVDPDSGEIARETIPRRDKQIPEGDVRCAHFLGGGCVIRADLLDEIGLFWERLNPFGAEEFDLSFRLLEAGYEILWTESIRMIHYTSPVSRPSNRRVFYEVRNRPWVALRHLPFRFVACHTVAWWGYMLIAALRGGHLWTWFRGVTACLLGVPEVWRLRRVVSRETIATVRAYSGPLYF
jgi:GT2 family glycosyltransferase